MKTQNKISKWLLIGFFLSASDLIVAQTNTDLTQSVCEGSTGEPYLVINTSGSSYIWDVIGGAGQVMTGQGTNAITIDWGSISSFGNGPHVLSVTETDINGCEGDPVTLEVSLILQNTISASISQTVCVNDLMPNITYATTGANGASFSGLPPGVTGAWSGDVVTISGSPTSTLGSPYTYTVTLEGGCGLVSTTGVISVTPENTLSLSSSSGSNGQSLCVNSPIVDITYATTGANGATFSGLPLGVIGAWSGDVVIISGSPTSTLGSPYTYTVTLEGGCGLVSTVGVISVTPENTIGLTSGANTDAQTVCLNTSITDITYATVGATGATVSGLPSGVAGSWSGDIVTISGTPTSTAGSPYNYTVTLSGGCGSVNTTGSISVDPNIAPSFLSVGPFCTGETIPALPTTSTNGISGTWSPAIDNSLTTLYTFTPALGLCAINQSLTISINPLPITGPIFHD
jgi:hypothetical protein